MFQRGFRLSVWQEETPTGEMRYGGRNDDSSSPHAAAIRTGTGGCGLEMISKHVAMR
jgi:hypothetical protein